jgi:hypothetical protein
MGRSMSNHSSPKNLQAVQAALKNLRDSLGKTTRPYHYSNEVGLIRFALTGDFNCQLDLKSLTRTQQQLLRRVICLNIKLINTYVDFKLRKETCRNLVLKAQSKPGKQKSAKQSQSN